MEPLHDPHLSQHELERYHLGMVKDEAELAPLEEHILSCAHCARRAEEIADYVDAIRAAASTLDETALALSGINPRVLARADPSSRLDRPRTRAIDGPIDKMASQTELGA